MSEQTVELNTKVLDQIVRAFKGKQPNILVANSRKDEQSNAVVCAAHEYGSSKLPPRSFLRMPINDDLEIEMEKTGAFNENMLKEVIRSGGLWVYCLRIAEVARVCVLNAFNVGGSSKTKWKRSNMKYKLNKQTLVETQQLRNSITTEVR